MLDNVREPAREDEESIGHFSDIRCHSITAITQESSGNSRQIHTRSFRGSPAVTINERESWRHSLSLPPLIYNVYHHVQIPRNYRINRITRRIHSLTLDKCTCHNAGYFFNPTAMIAPAESFLCLPYITYIPTLYSENPS